jgi:hypothetical protein
MFKIEKYYGLQEENFSIFSKTWGGESATDVNPKILHKLKKFVAKIVISVVIFDDVDTRTSPPCKENLPS